MDWDFPKMARGNQQPHPFSGGLDQMLLQDTDGTLTGPGELCSGASKMVRSNSA